MLKRNEVILWQGRPARSFAPGVEAIFPLFFGLLFTGIASYAVYRTLEGGVFFTVGFVFVAVGLHVVLHALFKGMLIRHRSHYALTNHRAFVMTDHP